MSLSGRTLSVSRDHIMADAGRCFDEFGMTQARETTSPPFLDERPYVMHVWCSLPLLQVLPACPLRDGQKNQGKIYCTSIFPWYCT